MYLSKLQFFFILGRDEYFHENSFLINKSKSNVYIAEIDDRGYDTKRRSFVTDRSARNHLLAGENERNRRVFFENH